MSEAEFVTLSCPTCGGQLQITRDLERFACGYCGNEHVVKRSGGVVSLSPVVEGIKQVQIGTDKTAAELAIQRLTKEIQMLEKQKQDLSGQSTGVVVMGCLIGFLGGAVVYVLFSSLNNTLGLALGVIAFFGVFAWIGNRRTKQNDAILAPINKEIQARRDELQKQKEMVDQP